MNIHKHSSKKRSIAIITLVTTVVIACAVILYLYFSRLAPNNPPAAVEPDTTTAKPPENGSDNTPPPTQQRETEKKPLQRTDIPADQSSRSLSGSISYQAVVDGQLILRTTMDQMLTSGTCTLVLKKADRTVTKTSQIIPNPSSSSCAGFSVPLTELGAGKWLIDIRVSSGERTGTMTSSITL